MAAAISAWAAGLALAAAVTCAAPVQGASVGQAAAFYHQGRYDSALTRLEALKSEGGIRHRDSLSLFQYLGMSSARLGREQDAVGYFTGLLGMDSLFQFPRNENPMVLSAFERARAEKTERESRPAEQSLPAVIGVPAASGLPASGAAALPMAAFPRAPEPEKISMADSGAPGSGGSRRTGSIGLGYGALPLGTGWLARHKAKQGLILGAMQAGGILLSIYASDRQTREESDVYRIRNEDERSSVKGWQWTQRISLSAALGAYLYSFIASAGD